jgi:hypothetical protein
MLSLLICSIAGCEKLPIPSEKPIKLNCHGKIDRGVFSDAFTKNSVETINSDITLSIGKGPVEMHGDGTEYIEAAKVYVIVLFTILWPYSKTIIIGISQRRPKRMKQQSSIKNLGPINHGSCVQHRRMELTAVLSSL